MLKLYELTVYDASNKAVFFDIFINRKEAEQQARLVKNEFLAVIEVVDFVDMYDTDAECFTVVLTSGTIIFSLSDYSPDGEYYDDVPDDCLNDADYVADLLEQMHIQGSAVHDSGLDMYEIDIDYYKYFKN